MKPIVRENMDDAAWVKKYSYVKMNHHKSAEKSSVAYTDFPFIGDRKNGYGTMRKVEIQGVFTGGDGKEYCRILYEDKKYQVPAMRLYKKPEKYSPSYNPEKADISRFRREAPKK